MLYLTCIRHAHSVHNAGDGVSTDGGLSEQGKEQARKLEGHYRLVVCSVQKRARETLSCSNISYDHVIYTELCREQKNGRPDTKLSTDDDNGTESEQELLARIETFKQFVRDKANEFQTTEVCVISHGMFLGYMCRKMWYNAETYRIVL
ncbi:MAG: phosphoglycerate mutase family protein [Sulfobacillus sp.]